MTDYRIRNQSLLYADRGRRRLEWRTLALVIAIATIAAVGVVSHLTDRFNAGGAAFHTAQQPAPPAAVRFATPGGDRTGS